ncbi:prolipoprotein diacylglyceryl transferase family protein [Undibacterium flavidum]|uniref:Prolipoprotein diacylglyceryl transferase n=1 Tax=Undibacterium flavidum TaxID=2762297 RepID=A0ABR6YG44_9BURK|nr:prolipoprotein diacylglyceryl transferase family protein [Undibacterium flavidum]MBC3875545.1 prolipoprotein diacylglyceryl transferase [Undibacterium flavidum]
MKSFVLSPSAAHFTHLVFEWLAIAIGVQLYRLQRARHQQSGILVSGHFGVIVACILGAAIGNKLVFWLEYPHLWKNIEAHIGLIFSGQSIVGGLIGGLIGVEIGKKLLHQSQSTGDNFVLPLIVSTTVGRIGCYLAGLNDGTYGNPTSMVWGIDFGDGTLRHPTQLYDILFVWIWGSSLIANKNRWQTAPGLMFKLYLTGYLFWRLFIDGFKPLPFDYGFGLSGIQIICSISLLIYLPITIRQLRKLA